MKTTNLYELRCMESEQETLESLLESQDYSIYDAERVAKKHKQKLDDCEFTVYEYPSDENPKLNWYWDSVNGIDHAELCSSVNEYVWNNTSGELA